MRTAPRLMFNKGVGVDFAVVSEAGTPFLPVSGCKAAGRESLNLIKEDKSSVNHAARRK